MPNPRINGESGEYYLKNSSLRALAFILSFPSGFVHFFLKRCKTSPKYYSYMYTWILSATGNIN